MAGHSHWAGIKYKKGKLDAKRGQRFTKLSRAITVAAREGGADPDGNPALALAIQKARDASMPKDTIERAIAKGIGAGSDRTGPELRNLFARQGGNIAEPSSVAWLFEKKGEILVESARYGEDDLLPAIDAGAEDLALAGDLWEIVTEPGALNGVGAALAAAGVEAASAELVQRPTTRTPIDEKQLGGLMRLIEALEDHDDVQAVHANLELDRHPGGSAELCRRSGGTAAARADAYT